MKTAALSTTVIGLSTNADELQLQHQLYFILIMLCSGSALSELRGVEDQNGLEGWRRLTARYEPKTRNRTLQLLDGCLSPDLSGDNAATVMDKLLAWELHVARYDAQAETKLADDIKIATLMKQLSEGLRYALLQLLGSSSATVSYSAIREYLVRFLSSARIWSSSDDMQIGALKGKGKGKNDEKTSSTSGGKGDVPGRFEGKCHYCDKQGHEEADCWKKQKDQGGGTGAGRGKGGKGGKKNGKGGKDQKKGKKVNAVEGDEHSEIPDPSNMSTASASTSNILNSSVSQAAVRAVSAREVKVEEMEAKWCFGLHAEARVRSLEASRVSSLGL
jgi:hypothetical protein